MVRPVAPVLPRSVEPGLAEQNADGSGTSVSHPNVISTTDGEDQRLCWTYGDALADACADTSFAGALMNQL